MTGADLLSDPDFLAFCQHWQDEGRAPFWAADWFEERGLDAYAVAWRWAERNGKLPYRFEDRDRVEHTWFTNEGADFIYHSGIPSKMHDGWSHNFDLRSKHCRNTFPDAILAFLVRWSEVFGTGTPRAKQEAVA